MHIFLVYIEYCFKIKYDIKGIKTLLSDKKIRPLISFVLFVFKRCGRCLSGCVCNNAWLSWHGEPGRVNQLSS